MFTAEISEHLKYYVYRLIDPRNGQTFYIGKGVGNRVFDHVKGESIAGADDLTNKIQRIREVRLSGFEVAHVVHRHGMDETTAFEVEAALIDAYPEVLNIMGGWYSDDRGVMHSNQIITKYQAKETEFHHKVLVISVNQSALEKGSIYEAVRYAWRVDAKKARTAELVLATRQGLVIGVFIPEEWLEAIPDNFPGAIAMPGRWGFVGKEAPEDLAKLYIQTRLPEDMRKRGSSNPVKYNFR